MAANTTSYSFYKPTVGGDTNLWGGYLNSNWDDIDDLLDGTTAISTNPEFSGNPVFSGSPDFSGIANASTVRTDIGLGDAATGTIGTDVQAYDATLTSIAALGTAADKIAYTTGVDTWAEAAITAAGRAILDDADASAQRTTLGLGGLATQDILDEDDFASDSATRPPSQQSTKAYFAANSVNSVFTESYTSSAQTITSAGLLTLAHGMASTPYFVSIVLKCTSAEHGYSVGDEIVIPPNNFAPGNSNAQAIQVRVDGTNIKVRFGDNASIMRIVDESDNIGDKSITNANWELYARAVA